MILYALVYYIHGNFKFLTRKGYHYKQAADKPYWEAHVTSIFLTWLSVDQEKVPKTDLFDGPKRIT